MKLAKIIFLTLFEIELGQPIVVNQSIQVVKIPMVWNFDVHWGNYSADLSRNVSGEFKILLTFFKYFKL